MTKPGCWLSRPAARPRRCSSSPKTPQHERRRFAGGLNLFCANFTGAESEARQSRGCKLEQCNSDRRADRRREIRRHDHARRSPLGIVRNLAAAGELFGLTVSLAVVVAGEVVVALGVIYRAPVEVGGRALRDDPDRFVVVDKRAVVVALGLVGETSVVVRNSTICRRILPCLPASACSLRCGGSDRCSDCNRPNRVGSRR